MAVVGVTGVAEVDRAGAMVSRKVARRDAVSDQQMPYLKCDRMAMLALELLLSEAMAPALVLAVAPQVSLVNGVGAKRANVKPSLRRPG
jgi:hypothetical protein